MSAYSMYIHGILHVRWWTYCPKQYTRDPLMSHGGLTAIKGSHRMPMVDLLPNTVHKGSHRMSACPTVDLLRYTKDPNVPWWTYCPTRYTRDPMGCRRWTYTQQSTHGMSACSDYTVQSLCPSCPIVPW